MAESEREANGKNAGRGARRPSAGASGERAQLPMPAIEGAVAVLLILGVLAGFAYGVATPDDHSAQLDAYASDTATILASEPPQHQGGSRLSEVAKSETAFERENAALRKRVARILPANVMFSVETPHGTVGHLIPGEVTIGTATVTTIHGDVTIRVWFA